LRTVARNYGIHGCGITTDGDNYRHCDGSSGGNILDKHEATSLAIGKGLRRNVNHQSICAINCDNRDAGTVDFSRTFITRITAHK
jgi:hypothetical protein